VSQVRKKFDKSPAIDAASNLRLVTMIQNHEEQYTEAEEEVLRDGLARFSKLGALKSKELKMASASTKAKIAFETGDKHAWGYAKATVRASPTEVRSRAKPARASKNERERASETSVSTLL
jgi:hypothetical protein